MFLPKISHFHTFLLKIPHFRHRKSEKVEISRKNRTLHAKIEQKTIVFERGELKNRVSERGKKRT